MIHKTLDKSNKNSRRIRFPNIINDAKTLGVSRCTLYNVLIGSPNYAMLKTLRARYISEVFLKKSKGERDFTYQNISDPELKKLIKKKN